jgi:hypothetical protein
MQDKILESKKVLIDTLKSHPKNYREHPDDQLAHIIHSIETNGLYRNIVVANDYTILAGHGVVKACKKMGITEVPIIHLDIEPDSSQALKILTGDNEVGRLAEVDDRELSEILKEIKVTDMDELLGTGYDAMMLANLAMVTRPASEIANVNEAAEWIGLPDYEPKEDVYKVVMSFRNAEDRNQFVDLCDIPQGNENSLTWSCWWPQKKKEDVSSLKYE